MLTVLFWYACFRSCASFEFTVEAIMLSPSRFVQELKIEELKKQVDAMKREIKNLQMTVAAMSKAIQDLKKHVHANIAKI